MSITPNNQSKSSAPPVPPVPVAPVTGFENLIYQEGDRVIIHSLGITPGEFAGRICGVSISHGDNPATIWIVKPTPEDMLRLSPNYPFSCITVPQSCLRRAINSSADVLDDDY